MLMPSPRSPPLNYKAPTQTLTGSCSLVLAHVRVTTQQPLKRSNDEIQSCLRRASALCAAKRERITDKTSAALVWTLSLG